MTVPISIFCALFADDIVLVVLGPKWTDAAAIFRLLTPTILVFGIINPTGWLLQSVGLHGRSLRIALVIAPLVIAACLIGLPYGPNGIAFAFSAAMTLWLVPHVVWCLHNTVISPWDFLSNMASIFRKHRGCNLCLCSPILFQSIAFAFLAALIGRRRHGQFISLDILVRYGAEIVLFRPSQGIEKLSSLDIRNFRSNGLRGKGRQQSAAL